MIHNSGTFVVAQGDPPSVRFTYLVTGNYQTEEGAFCRLVRLRDGAEKREKPAFLTDVSTLGVTLDRVVGGVVHFKWDGNRLWSGGTSGRLHSSCDAMVKRLCRGEPLF